jgi:hypothetical protein
MYIYIFEDGTTQAHDAGPTIEDIRCVREGLLTVLGFDKERRVLQLDPDTELWDWLPTCKQIKPDEGSLCHVPT